AVLEPRDDQERHLGLDQRAFGSEVVAHRLEEDVDLALTADAEVPRRDLVRRAAVGAAPRLAGADPARRDRAPLPSETSAADVARASAIMRDEQLRAFVTMRRAADAHDRRERRGHARTVERRGLREHLPRLEPLLHRISSS